MQQKRRSTSKMKSLANNHQPNKKDNEEIVFALMEMFAVERLHQALAALCPQRQRDAKTSSRPAPNRTLATPLGLCAAALPTPPKTSTNVPTNSARYFFIGAPLRADAKGMT